MKKLLIGLTVLFSFIFVSNVNAEIVNGNYTILEDIFDVNNSYNGLETNYYQKLKSSGKYESLIEYISNLGYKYYLFDMNYVYLWNSEDIYPICFLAYNSKGINNQETYYVNFNLLNPNSENILMISLYKYLYNSISKQTSTSKWNFITLGFMSDDGSGTGYDNFNSYTYNYNNNRLKYYSFIGFDTNKNIKFSTEYNNIYSGQKYYTSLTTGSKTYNDGDLVYSLAPTEPEINISLVEKTNNLEKIKINFNIWDKEKYSYEYKLTGMEVWEDIQENDFEYISYSNNTIYIQMIDKTTNESVLNATYTFSNITETIPDITFNESIPNSCKVLKNGTNYIVCKEIKANFNNYYGINNYLWSYSDDRENWTQIYNDKFVDLISENKVIYFKLYDRNTSETLKYMTYNITGIELIPSDLGQYITFNGKYENNNYKLDIIFYNYNNELYNYYYSTDGKNWTQLSLAEMSNYASIYSKYKSFNFYKDMTVYVKIEDKEANYITSATYQIKIPSIELFDTLNNLKVDNKILNYFTNIYNQIRTSNLGNYIFMLIVTSIILLIIKSARR